MPCLCLKTIEKELLESASEQTTSEIVSLTSDLQCRQFLNSFKKQRNIKIDSVYLPNLIDILIHYHEIVVLLHKFKSLFNSDIYETPAKRIKTILKS